MMVRKLGGYHMPYGYEFNMNPNWKDEVVAAAKEKLASVLKLRCPEHKEQPRLETVEGKLMVGTCCDAFEEQVKEALER
ncbi:MAG TPA: hypothetical protein VMS18_30375 [Candidatus Binatia bacterium]|nr:hypothetical protein [Candidatus Binatia bacterium]